MSAIAKSFGRGGTGNPGARGDRQKIIILVSLCVILVAVLAFELPKVLNGSSSSTTTSSAPGAAATTPAATATATSPPATAATSAATPTATAASAAALRTERWIKRRPARDPFLPLASATSAAAAAATPAPTPTPAPPAAATPSPAAVAAAAAAAAAAKAPKLIPTAAVIWTNGRRQVVGLKQLFQVGDTTFKLLSVGPKSIKVAVTVGGFKGGAKEITIARDKPVTFENTITGAQYALRFALPMSAVPAASSTSGK